MKTRADFATEEEFQDYYDQAFELPKLPPFVLLDSIKHEQSNRQEELNRKAKVLRDEESKLAALKATLNQMVLSGAAEADLDKMYDEIAAQEKIVQRRESEYQTISQARDTTKYTQAELKHAFDQYRSEFESVAVLPEYQKLAMMKAEYLEAFHALERQILAFNERATEVDHQLNRLHKLQGGVIYGSQQISVKYDNLDIKVPRNKEVW